MSETVLKGFIPLDWAFEIADRDGAMVLRVTFADAVRILN